MVGRDQQDATDSIEQGNEAFTALVGPPVLLLGVERYKILCQGLIDQHLFEKLSILLRLVDGQDEQGERQ
jgi:hypothetical protein